MSILTKLTLANLRQNRRRTGVTVIGVALSSAPMLAVAGMVTSVQRTMIDATIESTGNYHEMYEKVPEAGRKYIENNANIESYYYAGPVEFDEEWVARLYEDNPHMAYHGAYIGAAEDGEVDLTRIYVRYRDLRSFEAAREWITEVIEENTGETVNYRTNRQLIQYEGGVSGAAMGEIVAVATIVMVIIVATSVLAIRNSFSISAAERTRQFGMLGSVGATRRQIRWLVLLEGLTIWAIGVPIGMLLGLIATAILVVVVTALIGDGLAVPMVFAVPGWVLPVIAGLSLVTVLLSALLPAIRAARRSPIEAMRGDRDLKIKPRRMRVSLLTREMFGIGGVIASKNLKRSRRKYRTTVISIVISVATFIGLTTFMNQAFGTLRVIYPRMDYDLLVNASKVELLEEIGREFDLKEVIYDSDVFDTAPGDVEEESWHTMMARTDEADAIIEWIEAQRQVDTRYLEVNGQNMRKALAMMNNLYMLVAIFLYGFIMVITLIGVTNVFNTISANMMLRAPEFAALKSVGMTSREFNRMIWLESLMYSVKALVIGVPLGILLSYGFYQAMTQSGNYDGGYAAPVKAILIAMVAVGVLIFAVMRYSLRLVKRQNIIETIRSGTV